MAKTEARKAKAEAEATAKVDKARAEAAKAEALVANSKANMAEGEADKARADGGFGLGLSLADSIARAHGAAIDVRSAEGAGSTFRVVFSFDMAATEPPKGRLTAGPTFKHRITLRRRV